MNKQINKQGKKIEVNSKYKNGNKIFEQVNKEKNKINKENINLKNNEINFYSNINYIPQIDSKYRKQLDDRMDMLMEKIDQNINNNNYNNQINMIIHNSKINYINNYNNNPIPENMENEENEVDNVEHINEEKDEDELNQQLETKMEDNSEKKNTQENIKRESEIINKLLKRNKFLENEVDYLKFRLNKVENQKNFVQNIIKNDTYIKRHLFDIFIVDYFKKIALNWKNVSNELIDELITDEIHELTKVKLKLRHINRSEEGKEQKLNEKKELTSIDMKEYELFNENLKGIKQTIKSVKESERNLCKKYKIKLK